PDLGSMNRHSTVYVLLTLLVLLGTGAIFGGGVLIISPKGDLFGMPLSILDNSLFNDFLIPGIILFTVLGITPICIVIALLKKPEYKIAELFNIYKDMYWAWTYCIYIAFALIIWIQIEMTILRAVHWSHTLYMFFAIAILFVALFPKVRNSYKK
ncbi:MAG: hypothetical protein WAT91_04155, partial [Saprospiraceae bacterium]